MIDIERESERGRDTGGGSSRLHAGSPTGTRSRGPRIKPWAKGRRQTAEPPRDPPTRDSKKVSVPCFSPNS